MFKRCISVLLILVCTLSFTACWDHVEISNMLIVAGIGLDLEGEGGLYHATVEVIDVAAEGGENIASQIVEGSGDSLYSAIQDAMVMTGGTMFTNHCKLIVIGDNLARHGVNEIVDLVLRNPGLRKSLEVLVAKDTTAKSILTQKTVKSDIVSFELAKMLINNAETMNNTSTTSMYKLHEAFLSNCPSAVVPLVSTKKNNKETVLYVEGTAIIFAGKLQGFLSGEQSATYNILKNQVKSASITYRDGALSPEPITAGIIKSHVHLTPGMEGESLSMLVQIREDVSLRGPAALSGDLTDPSTVHGLETGLEAKLETDAMALITELQAYGVDIFDFGSAFEAKYKEEWETLRQDWQAHFREIDVSVSADVVVTGSGLIGNYAPFGDEANALP